MTWNYEPKVLSCMSPQERTICEIIYVNSDIPRMGMVYLTSHLHTISPCRLMSPHLAGGYIIGGGLYNKRENKGQSTERSVVDNVCPEMNELGG